MSRHPKDDDVYEPKEAQRRFVAALRGARSVGHKPQSEMKLGKPRGKASKSLARGTSKKPRKKA